MVQREIDFVRDPRLQPVMGPLVDMIRYLIDGQLRPQHLIDWFRSNSHFGTSMNLSGK